jgi:hypothetical protein
MSRPDATDYAGAFEGYVSLVPEDDILATLRNELSSSLPFLRGIPESEAGKLHPPYTWTARQVVGHLIDSERIFAYRALRIGRGDPTPLAGFDENPYVQAGEFDRLPLADLVAEFETVRQGSQRLFEHFPAEAWKRKGMSNNGLISVRALAYIIIGHERHHLTILRRRMAHAR